MADKMQFGEDVIDTRALLVRAGVSQGMTVADCGCGREALFSMISAQMVAPTGIVYALDVVQEVLAIVKEKAQSAGVNNLLTVWTDLELLGAAKQVLDNSVDVAILANTLFQSQQREAIIRECLRMLKPAGTMLMVDWKTVPSSFGPELSQRISQSAARQLAEANAMQVIEQFEAGEYHWGMVLRK